MFRGIKAQIAAAAPAIGPMVIETIQDAIQFVGLVCETESVAGDRADMVRGILTDAHKYTRTQIRAYYPRLTAVDDQFCQSTRPILEFPALVAAIEQHANRVRYPAANRADLQRILGMITAFVNSPTRGVENSESMIGIPELLLRCWNLAQRTVQRTGDVSVLTQILNCLDGNIIDGGGCMPGVVARLYPAYARLLQYQLTRAPALVAAPMQRDRALAVNRNEAEDLARAIRNSLQQDNTPNEREQAELTRALNASRIDARRAAVAAQAPAPVQDDLEFALIMALSALDANDINPDVVQQPPVVAPIVNQFRQQQIVAAPAVTAQLPPAEPLAVQDPNQEQQIRAANVAAKFKKRF